MITENLTYTITEKTKKICFALMGVGLLSMIAMYFVDGTTPENLLPGDEYHHNRFWANLLLNSTFFMGIALLAAFFMAMQYAAESAWSVAVKRVYEAISDYLPIAVGIVLVLLLIGQLGGHHLYHWMDSRVYDESSDHYDKIIAGKKGYFAPWFFWLRSAGFAALWIYFQRLLRKRSLEEDLVGGTALHYKNFGSSAVFLLIFGVSSSTQAWDWLMSLDTHWFSTMYGWYTFAGWWISSLTVTTMFILYLRAKGYMQWVNESHIHDMGKWMFAISFLWTYLYFCQFMLYWYTNIPEEVSYFVDRIHSFGYVGLLWTVFFVNFAFPMTLLMARDTKRNYKYLIFVGSIILIGHWLDTYLMIMPATVKGNWHLNYLEIGVGLGFLGLFLFFTHKALAKAPLLAKNHPYVEESLHHHI